MSDHVGYKAVVVFEDPAEHRQLVVSKGPPRSPGKSRMGWIKLTAVIVLLIAGGAATYVYNELRIDAEQVQAAIALTGGNPVNAPALIVRYGCAGCHMLEQVPEARGQVGPALDDVARRTYVGVLTNTPEHLIDWIVDPRAIDPQSPMPRTGITREEARDVASYLYSLR